MVDGRRPGEVINLGAARGRRVDVAAMARDRFASSRRASGLSPHEFADVLMDILGWPVTPEAVLAWEESGVPPGDVLSAAEIVVGLAEPATSSETMAAGGSGFDLVADYGDVQAALARVIDGARETLATTGSRSRDPDYLTRIESAIADRPTLVHYRVLHGPPRGGALKNHLLRLVDLRQEEGSVKIGIMWDIYKDPERFLCASEREAVVVLPSLTSTSNFDTALVISRSDIARAYVDHVRQAFLASDALTNRAMIEALEVVR